MDWIKVKHLYQACLEKSPAERTAFLDAACAGDDELRREIETLLAEEEHAERFLEDSRLKAGQSAPSERRGSLAGRAIGRHQITLLLGAGGMGEVYLSHDTRLGRNVALKILPPEFAADRDRMKRFTLEAKAASALNHPNVATIYDIGEEAGVCFIAMEYVEGQTLSQEIDGRPLPTSDVIDIGKQAADALDAAHSKGITHRDIKPTNLMITPRGQVKVLDFGLAKVVHPPEGAATSAPTNVSATMPGFIMGTAAYMSPEQVSGLEVDHRSDIFSLGVVLYEMLTGCSPFLGANPADTMARILLKQPEPISQINPNAPRELERIIRKCLDKDRAQRYSSARDLFVDLNNVYRNSDSIAAPAIKQSRSFKLAVLTAAIALILAAVWATGLFRAGRPPIGRPIESLVVLPFTNHGADSDSEALCDGVSESLINSLSQVRTLSVIHRTTSRSYKGKTADPRQIGRDLNVQAVVTGECSPQSDSLNIQVDLMDVASNTTLWADRYPARVAEILSVQDSIAAQIADRLRLRLSGEEQQRLTRHGTADPEAYQLFLLARHYALKSTRDGFAKALQFFDDAIKRDPDYAMAYAGKAEAYMIASDLFLPSIEAGRQAEDLAIAAIGRDHQLSEAHCALAIVLGWYKWDWRASEREFEIARNMDPASGCVNDAYPYGLVSIFLGKLDDGIAELNRALRLDPRSAVRRVNLGNALYYAKRYDEAEEEFRMAKSLDPNYFLGPLSLGILYTETGKYEQALEEFRQLPPAEFRDAEAFQAFVLARGGRRDEAEKILDQLLKPVKQGAKTATRATSAWAFATLYTALGNKDEAFKWLYQARDERFIVITGLKLDPIFASLRSDKRFAPLIREIGLEP